MENILRSRNGRLCIAEMAILPKLNANENHFTNIPVAYPLKAGVGGASVGENMEKSEHSYVAGENIKWYNHYRKQLASFSKS